jgi:PAS domain S-box-containing protein
MKHLTIARKLALLGLLFMIPFATVTYMMVASINSEKVEFARLELMGTAYDAPLSALLRDLQEHNAASVAWLNGDPSFQDVVAGKRDVIEADLFNVDAAEQRLGPALHTSALWESLRTSIQTLLDQTPHLSADDSLAQHQKAIDATVFLISKVSDNSKLTLDPDIDTYYLMNAVMFQGPATSDFLSQARSLASRLLAAKSGTPAQYDELSRLSTLADFSQAGVADSYSRASGFNPTLAPELGASADAGAAGVRSVTTAIRSLVASRQLEASAGDMNADLSRNIALLFRFENDATKSLNRLLELRLAHWQDEVNFTLGAAGLGLLGVLVIGYFVARDITIPLRRVVEIANKVASGQGSYSVRVMKRRNDELGVLIDAFNKMLHQIQERDAVLERRVSERTAEVVTSLSLVTATLESTTDGILVTDATGNPTNFNGKFLEMWKIQDQGHDTRGKQKTRAVTSPLSSDYARFLTRIRDLLAHPEEESFDQLELRDGRLFEQYSKPQRVDSQCVGRVWSFRDITERRRADREMEQLNRQLLDSSRQAGMAEVATSVLHNVGNVLNSVNVSCSFLSDLIKKSKVEYLARVVEMLTRHASDLGTYLTVDPKGRQLPAYLGQLSEHLAGQQGSALQELDRLQENIDHIKEIVVMQQGYAKVSGIVETLSITSLLEDALRLNLGSLERHGVEVLRHFENVAPIEMEKHRILQILVNLIRNAGNACDESPRADKQIMLRVSTKGDRVRVAVTDNGIGIPAENLNRIFGHGFTTKKDGHGFGLHSAALSAKEMGGSLEVHSNGPNQGATFTLELPRATASLGAQGLENSANRSPFTKMSG